MRCGGARTVIEIGRTDETADYTDKKDGTDEQEQHQR
jgi:hypothetical protein